MKKTTKKTTKKKNLGGRPPHFKEPKELEAKFLEYIDYCKSNPIVSSDRVTEKPVTLSGFCVYINSYKEIIMEYSRKPKFSRTIKAIRNYVENNVEEGILAGKYNATAGIFNLKNNFGWKDKQEIDQKTEMNVSVSELRENVLNDLEHAKKEKQRKDSNKRTSKNSK